MKKIVLLFAVLFVNFCYSQSINNNEVLGDLNIYYTDSVTNSSENKYRELKFIGDEPYFSKPLKFDIILNLLNNYINGYIEVYIEEYFIPDTAFVVDKKVEPYWGLNKVLYGINLTNEYKKDIQLKEINYKTVYFKSSRIYPKEGFRIVAIFIPSDKNKQIEIVKKEFFYFND